MSDHLPIIMKVIVGENLGLQNIQEKDFSLSLQNPVQDDIYLTIVTEKQIDLILRVSNLQGKLIYSATLSIDGMNSSYKIPLSKFPRAYIY